VPDYTFCPQNLRTGFAIAKIVKPATGDYHLKFDESALTVFSYDKRRYVRVTISPDAKNADPGFLSKDFFIIMDRVALFTTDLDSVIIGVNDKSLSIHCVKKPDQNRKAVIKKRIIKLRRPEIPEPISMDGATKIDRGLFDKVLHQASCSALVKDTKTEEAMRINQVHFYSDKGYVVSNARYYGSIVYADLGIDLSIVSSDIPIIRAFCSRCDSEYIYLTYDDKRMNIIDGGTMSVLSISRISTKRPEVTLLDPSLFTTTVVADRELLTKNVEWAVSVIDDTERVNINVVNNNMKFVYKGNELANFPVVSDGGSVDADYPIRYMSSMLRFVDGEVVLRFGHKLMPTVMEISQKDPKVKFSHYLQSMRKY